MKRVIILKLYTASVISGMMSNKLLNRTLRINLIFSFAVLLITAPLFYIAIQKLYLNETDETLLLKKNRFVKEFQNGFKSTDIYLWNKINKDIKIVGNPVGYLIDSFYYKTYFDSIAMEDEHCRVLESPITIGGQSFLLEQKISLVEAEDLQENIALLFTGILIFLLSGFYFITKGMSRKLWLPFYNSLDKIEQFEVDKDSSKQEFMDSPIEEFKRLNLALSKLIERNTSIYNSQREFVENAAHELQTPLAIFQAKIDTLIQRKDITEEQALILSQLNDAAGRLNKLNKNLLLLSKIEGHQFYEKETVYLNDIFEKQIDFFEEQAQSKNISIALQLHEKVELQTNHVLLEVFISNLFLNALRHNVQNGVIQVRLERDFLVFSNSGMQQALDDDKLFKRFAKVHPGSSGNGLGLAILKKIGDINGWKIQYKYENNLHNFEIRF